MKGVLLFLVSCVLALNSFADTADTTSKAKEKFKFLVLDRKTREPLDDAVIQIKCFTDSSSVSVITGKDGYAEADLKKNYSYYFISSKKVAEKDAVYLSTTTTLIKSSSNSSVTFTLERVNRGPGCVYIDNAYFDAGKTSIRPDAAKTLDKFIKIMLENPTIEIEISAHSDCLGSKEGNMATAVKRAKAVVDYLVKGGISENRLTQNAWGDTRPVNSCDCSTPNNKLCTEVEYQMNRRVEFKILKF